MLAVEVPSRAAVRRLATARLVSVAGTVSADVALALVLYGRTHSAVWVSGALLLGFGVPAVVSPLSGAIGDRFDRRRVLIGSDVLGAGCFVAMALVRAPTELIGVAFCAALAEAPFLPASGSALPAVAPHAELPWANSRLAAARTAGQLVGPLLGGGLVAAAGAHAAFFVNAGSFFASALIIGSLRGPLRRPRSQGDPDQSAALMAGFAIMFANPLFRALTLGFVLVDIGNGLIMPAEVVLAHALSAGAVGYGALVAGWGLGGILAAQHAPKLFHRRDEPWVVLLAAGGLALAFAVVALTPWFALALVGFTAGGATMSVAGIGEDLLLQRRIDDDVRGRVYAAHIAVVQLSLAMPLLAAGVLVDSVGPQAVFGLASGVTLLGAVALAAMLRPATGHAHEHGPPRR